MRTTQTFLITFVALLASACGGSGAAREEVGGPREEAGTARERFDAVALDARAQEAGPVLKQAYTLQQAYQAENQRYAATFPELETVGWENPPGLRQYHAPRIVRAEGEALCMQMDPVKDDLWPQHVDQSGQVQRGPCP